MVIQLITFAGGWRCDDVILQGVHSQREPAQLVIPVGWQVSWTDHGEQRIYIQQWRCPYIWYNKTPSTFKGKFIQLQAQIQANGLDIDKGLGHTI